jgi:tetratricopeptide (TPR) repeat protein
MIRRARAFELLLLSSTFVSAARAAENKLSVDLPAVPDTVRAEQKKFDERSAKTVPADAKIMEPGANKQAVDMALPPKAKTPLRGDATKAPLVNLAPPDSIRGWTGQVLEMNGGAAGTTEKGAEKLYYSWILDGEVICHRPACQITLDGKAIKPGAHSLLFVAYNVHGSTQTKHILYVQKSTWDASKPLVTKMIRSEDKTGEVARIPVIDPKSLNVSMLEGNAVQVWPGNVIVAGAAPRNVPWEGQLKTAPRAVARATDPLVGRWFILGNSQINFFKRGTDKPEYRVKLDKGMMRIQSTEKIAADAKIKTRDNVTVSTNEVSVYLDPNLDAVMIRTAPPAAANERRKNAKSKSEIAKDDQFQTHVVSISGTARFQLPSPPDAPAKKIAEMPPGVELVIYEDGTVGPFERPKGDRMEQIIKQTLTPEEIKERERRKEEAKKKVIDLAALMKRVIELNDRGDYFEMLSELETVEDRKVEDVRIAYYLGIAYKGLYQPLEAEKNFRAAMEQDKNFADAPWQLGLMQLDEKKWPEALDAFSEAKGRMKNDDPRSSEYQYYAGVAAFNNDSQFYARNHFSRALMWEDTLEASLKSSSGAFLKKLRDRKPWSLMVPVGVQYDANQASTDESLFKPDSLFRSLSGANFAWDPASINEAPGWYNGATAGVMYAKHFPEQFKSFNMLSLSAAATHTKKFEVAIDASAPSVAPSPEAPPATIKTDEKSAAPKTTIQTLKISESASVINVGNAWTGVSLAANANWNSYDATATYDYDLKSASNAKTHGLTLKAATTKPVWEGPKSLRSDVDLYLQQRVAMVSNSGNTNTLTLSAAPSLSYPINMLTSSKFATGFTYTKELNNLKTISFSTAPNLTITRFISPWLVGMGTLSYELVYKKLPNVDASIIHKPGATVILSGLF